MCEHITPISFYPHRHLYKEDLELKMDIFMRVKNVIVSTSNSSGHRNRMRGGGLEYIYSAVLRVKPGIR